MRRSHAFTWEQFTGVLLAILSSFSAAHAQSFGDVTVHPNGGEQQKILDYAKSVQDEVRRNWQGAKEEFSNLVVALTVNSDGTVSNLNLEKTSGFHRYDLAALTAVEKAQPFARFPFNCRKTVPMRLRFESHPPVEHVYELPLSVERVVFEACEHIASAVRPMPPSSQPDVDFGPYMAGLQRRIHEKVVGVSVAENTRAVALLRIQASGEVSSVKLLTRSLNRQFDENVLSAMRNVALRPLPKGAPADIDVQFTFDLLADPAIQKEFVVFVYPVGSGKRQIKSEYVYPAIGESINRLLSDLNTAQKARR